MKELVVLSGKGGTGKTSIIASLAVLAERAVLVDCDVDAADLHLILDPTERRRTSFSGGSRARILPERCDACGDCRTVCRFEAIEPDDPGDGTPVTSFHVDPIACEGCGLCAFVCKAAAVEFAPVVNGEWYVSDTRIGPFVHARLQPGEENSGKLVSVVRSAAKEVAEDAGRELILIDGSPGIGCPVIASVTGASLVLIVTEPTPSGRHDSARVMELTEHFAIPTCLSVNKWDLNEQVTQQIEAEAEARGVRVLDRVRYDPAIREAQFRLRTVVEHTKEGAAADVRRLWRSVSALLAEPARPIEETRRAGNG